MKAADAESDDFDNIAQAALKQIDEKAYTTKMEAEFKTNGYTQPIVKIALVYFQKRVTLAAIQSTLAE